MMRSDNILQSLSARPPAGIETKPLTSRESRGNFAASYLRIAVSSYFFLWKLFSSLGACMLAQPDPQKNPPLQECLPVFLGRSLPSPRSWWCWVVVLPLAGKTALRKARERKRTQKHTGCRNRVALRTTRRKGTRHPKLLRLFGRNSPRRIRPVVLRRSQRQDRQARTSAPSRLASYSQLC